jgi:hypothetical protein
MDKSTYMERINTFIQKGNYHAAINIALSGLNACRKESDQAGIDEFLDVIKGIAKTLAEEFGSETYLENF